MAKNRITTRGKQTVRWSTLPAENELLNTDLLLVARPYTDNSDLLLLECVKAITTRKADIGELVLLLKTNVSLFRKRSINLIKKYNLPNSYGSFNVAITEIKDYFWSKKTEEFKLKQILDMIGKIYFGVERYSQIIEVNSIDDLKLNSDEFIQEELIKAGLPEEYHQFISKSIIKTKRWLETGWIDTPEHLTKEIIDSRLIWLNEYPLEEKILLARVSKSLGRGELNLYQKLTISSNMTYGVPLSELKRAHEDGNLYEIEDLDRIKNYPRFYNRHPKLNQIINFIKKQKESSYELIN